VKLPKRISEILKRKQEFIDSQRTKLETSVVKFQSQLFSDIVSELIPQLTIKNGIIEDNVHNYKLISSLDKVYKDFQNITNTIVLNQVVKTTEKIASTSQDYFKVILSDNMVKRFDKIVETTDKLINLRLGLDGGKLVRGGYL
jgi:hypothetical protein